ncbi:uncharacterized protein K460DRAFT_365265 [Cucurbitaria berberidis CBS 394.84]|uniref:Uncharacterized protein n=1 Tax=Cucurbitaria berberidis CBS 394.84 TaxID=1168544 RepID=A0A9P4LC67_9PLEO|nr:uncharacterized protein K460DRAFT_365265 [Cucurbitaria berberidis CBS 394.84]KAF1849383.1 hypothetical protein K460DRAFT_365265 [Cucurbitaria berberidis CBS 394.84]
MARELTGSGTSKIAAVTRKPKKSTSVFFTASPIPATRFMSATEDLERRRAERETAQAVETGGSGCQAQVQLEALIEIEDECVSQTTPSSSSFPSTSGALSTSASRKTKSPLSPFKTAVVKPAPTAELQAKTPHFKDLYHYYLDTTGFEYKIVLARSDFSTNSFARYHIGLLESHTKPPTYCTVVQYTPPAKRSPESSLSAIPRVGLRNPLLRFLNHSEDAIAQRQPANKNGNGHVKGQTAQDAQDSEATRLRSLITKPAPVSETPYKALICPMNSDYTSAWRAFRHAFRDLTLLTWEERFDANRTFQKARAKVLDIEPFLYSKPTKGLPMGLLPQENGHLQGSAHGLEVRGEVDDGYVRNAFNLPSISHPLGENGAIGSALLRDEQERKKIEEQKIREAEELEERERRKRGEVKVKRPNYNAPMFNCATGRPSTDAYGQYTRNIPVGAARLGGGTNYAGLIRKSRPWPRERDE